MRKNAINEFKVWTWFMAIGLSVLGTELAVKAKRPSHDPRELTPVANRQDAPTVAETSSREEVVASLLVEAVIQVESGGQPDMVGSKGERGLMQVMESTWKETTRRQFGQAIPFAKAFDPELNRTVGTAYLAHLHQFLQGHREEWQADERSLLLACYNAGPQRVAKAGFKLDKLPASTRDYVSRASSLHDSFLQHEYLSLAPGSAQGEMKIVQWLPSRGI